MIVLEVQVEFPGLDGFGGPLYIGTGCFHRRDTLCGRKFTKGLRFEWKGQTDSRNGERNDKLEERVKALASCTFELNTQWGHEVFLFPRSTSMFYVSGSVILLCLDLWPEFQK